MKISEIELLGSFFLKLSAIQSVKQLGSYVAATLIGFSIFQVILIYFDQPIAAPITLLVAFAGSSVVLRMMLPARFKITMDTPQGYAEMKNFLEESIMRQGYGIKSREDGSTIFQSRLPAPLKWNENEILMTKSGFDLVLKGPVFMIKILHNGSSKKL